MKISLRVGVVACCAVLCGCTSMSPWKLVGGPESCRQICESWGLEFTAIVAVGDQDLTITDGGATACVCQPAHLVASAPNQAAVAVATSLAAPIQQERDEEDDEGEQ